jgi:hypothetical protein
MEPPPLFSPLKVCWELFTSMQPFEGMSKIFFFAPFVITVFPPLLGVQELSHTQVRLRPCCWRPCYPHARVHFCFLSFSQNFRMSCQILLMSSPSPPICLLSPISFHARTHARTHQCFCWWARRIARCRFPRTDSLRSMELSSKPAGICWYLFRRARPCSHTPPALPAAILPAGPRSKIWSFASTCCCKQVGPIILPTKEEKKKKEKSERGHVWPVLSIQLGNFFLL